MIKLNENGTVRLAGLQPEMDIAMYVVEDVLNDWLIETVITAGTEEFYPDGSLIHSVGSLHPRGYALDFRRRDIPSADFDEVIKLIRDALHKISLAYDVVVEGNHIHIEFDVKKNFILMAEAA